VVVTVVLAVLAGERLAGRWLLIVGGAFAVILALKLAFGIWPSLGAGIDVSSPSGHTACATAVYGALAVLLWGTATGMLVAIAVAALTGVTRVALDLHSPAETLIGAVVGLTAVALFARGRTPSIGRRRALAALVLVVIVPLYGHKANIEPTLRHIEAHWAAHGPA
jgi:membrane-associated phospholipid phosphatase